jgi:hypothetical protein
MKLIGKVVAILNEHQVLARAIEVHGWSSCEVGDELSVVEERVLPVQVQSAARTEVVYLPKGTLLFLATQLDPSLAILTTRGQVQRRLHTRPSTLQAFLGASASGVGGFLEDVTEGVPSRGSPSATIDQTHSLNFDVGSTRVGDLISTA